MKTMAEWKMALKTFDKFAKQGDEVDEEIYQYFLEVLPPETHTNTCLQVGEPYGTDEQGRTTFTTFMKVNGEWVYVGNQPKVKGEK